MVEEHECPGASILLLAGPAVTAATLLVAAVLAFALSSNLDSISAPTNEQSGLVASPAWSLGDSPLGGSALSDSLYTADGDEDDGIADFLGVGLFLPFLSPFIGRLLAICREPQRLRDIYYYSRLGRPG